MFPAIDGAELGEPYWEVSIGALLGFVDADVHGTIHRSEQVSVDFSLVQLVREFCAGAAFFSQLRQTVAVDYRGILGGLIVREVPGSAEKVKFSYVRSENLRVALLGKFRGYERFKLLTNNCTIGFPKNKTLPDHVVDMKKS